MFDWHQFHRDETPKPAVVDPRRRVRICLVAFGVLLVAIFARAVQLELADGAAYRAEALRPVEKERSVPGVRGKILARDGTILGLRQGNLLRGGALSLSAKSARSEVAENHRPGEALQIRSRQTRASARRAESSAGRARRIGASSGETLQHDRRGVVRSGGSEFKAAWKKSPPRRTPGKSKRRKKRTTRPTKAGRRGLPDRSRSRNRRRKSRSPRSWIIT